MFLSLRLLVCLAGLSLAASGPALAAPPQADTDRDGIYENLEAEVSKAPASRDVRVIVALEREATAARVQRLEQAVASLDSRRRYDSVDAFAATVDAGRVRALANQPEVTHVELDAPVHTFNSTAQSSFGVTAARTAVPALDGDADGASTYSKNDLVAAVIDTGIDAGHVNLDGGKVIAFQDFTETIYDSALDPAYDDNDHGTHVAGTIAGDGDGSADGRGVAPGAALVGLKVLDAQGSGFTSDVVAAIDWARANKAAYGIDVINMSLGSSGCSDGTGTEATAINNAVAAGIAVVVAAGNSGPGRCTIGSPGAVASAITVGAMADQGVGGFFMAGFSSRGKTLDGRIKPDVVAPGVRIRSADANSTNGYLTFSGTSMATPFVAGVALLMLDQDAALTPGTIKSKIRTTAVDWGRGGDAKTAGSTGADIDHGAGRLDAHAALLSAGAAVGGAPAAPAHQLAEGTLAGTGQATFYKLTASGSTFPLAVSLTVAGDDPNNDGVTDATATGDCHLIDFNAYLYDSAGNAVSVYGQNGAARSAVDGCQRQDAFWRPAGAVQEYTLKIVSRNGSGGFFLDVSGGTAVEVPAPPSGGTPSVSGDARDGSALTASPGTWTGAGTITYAYQWQRCDTNGTACMNVAGATGARHTLSSPDVGSTYRVVVTASNAGGAATASSAATAVVGAVAPQAQTAPTIAGAAAEGAALTGTDGTWSGTTPIHLSREWLRCDASGTACSPIPGATATSYTVTAADVGRRIRLRVRGSNSAGSATRDSDPTAPVAAKPAAEPAEEQAEEQAVEQVVEPAEERAVEPAREPVAEPTTRLVGGRAVGAVRLEVACAADCALSARLTAPRSLRKVLSRARILGERAVELPGGTSRVGVAVRRKALRKLRAAGLTRTKAVLTLRVVDSAGQVTRTRELVRVRVAAKRPVR